MATIGELFQHHSGDPIQLDRTARIFFGVKDREPNLRERITHSRSARILTIPLAAAMGWYGLHTLSHEPVCTSGTPVKVTNPTSFALRGTFTSHGCDVSGGTKVVLLARDSTGEQYAAPREDVQPITQ